MVDKVGDGVTDVAVGDEVFGFAVDGGAVEYALLDHYAGKPAPLDQAPEAQRTSQAGHVRGKLVLIVDSSSAASPRPPSTRERIT